MEKRILVLDDSRQWERHLKDGLSEIAQSLTIVSGENAVDLLKREDYGLVIVEPEPVDLLREGINLLRLKNSRLKATSYARKRGIPVLIFSVAQKTKLKEYNWEEGINYQGYLIKPFEIPLLLDEIIRLYDNDRC